MRLQTRGRRRRGVCSRRRGFGEGGGRGGRRDVRIQVAGRRGGTALGRIGEEIRTLEGRRSFSAATKGARMGDGPRKKSWTVVVWSERFPKQVSYLSKEGPTVTGTTTLRFVSGSLLDVSACSRTRDAESYSPRHHLITPRRIPLSPSPHLLRRRIAPD